VARFDAVPEPGRWIRPAGGISGRVRVGLIALQVVVALAVGCGTAGDDEADDTAADATTTESTAGSTTTTEPEDFVAEADDFVNLHDMTRVRNLFISNPLGHLDEAVAVANSPDGGVYPVGTIIQLIPQEAMIKRAPGFSPDFGDWEFFELDVSPEGTVIVNRGGSEVVNRFGGFSCANCHAKADPQWDLVCEDDHGCDPLPIQDEVFIALQDADPRPRLDGGTGSTATTATTSLPTD
jgi:hypothetical protein